MKCPVCKIDMIVVEHKKIELDYCVRCLGVWFDSEELELLLETMKAEETGLSQTSLLTPHAARPAEKKRKCPICGHKMDKVSVGKEPEVLIDSCPQGEGLWFDGGELGEVITQTVGKPSGKPGTQGILSFLGDVFRTGGKPNSKK